jgi:hypothetical protein
LLVGLDDPTGRSQRFIPSLLQTCDLPKRIAILAYADFQVPDENKWRLLIGQLTRLVGATTQTTVLQPVILPPQNPFYGDSLELVGREHEIQRIQEKLRAGNHCSVVGPHGSGKSFVLKYVREQLPAWFGWSAQEILSLGFRTISSLKELQEEFVVQLGGRGANEWRSLLRSKPPRLLVLDDLGGMDRGGRGLNMRRWLRGLDDYGVKLLCK